MAPSIDTQNLSRRRILQLSGAVGVAGLGAGRAIAHEDEYDLRDNEYCSETTLRSDMVHYDDSIHNICEDDHPESQALQADVRNGLQQHYPTVGALIDAGFIPYLDFFADRSWSHWINPAFVGDEATLDPARPESVLVDHEYWRPIGVMFIATRRGKPMDPPPTIYETRTVEGSDLACIPWHAHVGLPGRLAWWKYEKVHHGKAQGKPELPCKTPWMMHVWIYPHGKSIYAHGAPDERGGPPAEDPGFATDADPDREDLGPEHLPDAIREKVQEMR